MDYVQLARKAIKEYLLTDTITGIPASLDEVDSGKKGVFVSLKKDGHLRGCIGTITGTFALPEEIVRNAIAAATEDPRFYPVRAEELDALTISVDVLEPEEPVISMEELDPAVYGVIVEKGSRKGLLLPNLEGVSTAEDQVAIAKEKAGIRDDDFRLKKFKVTRYY